MAKNWLKFFIILILIIGLGIFGYFQLKVLQVRAKGLALNANGLSFNVDLDQIGFPKNGFAAMMRKVQGAPMYDQNALDQIVSEAAAKINFPAQNFDIAISNGSLGLITQTHPGRVLDQAAAKNKIGAALDGFYTAADLPTVTQDPTVSLESAEQALAEIRGIIQNSITLNHNGDKTKIDPPQISAWITTAPNGKNLAIGFDDKKILSDLAAISAKYEQTAEDLDFKLDSSGKITDFHAPQDGISIDKETAKDTIIALLKNRISGQLGTENPVELSDQIVKAGTSDQAKQLGIKELIGTATTTFAGSTKNRISNIKTGADKLNGSLVQPGQEFSTIKLLGEVDAAHGFVQELVIKGPNTIPEFGGGLCQVSTTLFRAVLNAGLPVTERQNHSYRVSFYEKDGNGKSIGPGLDATIYEPHPDFRFKNDTANSLLVTDQVIGKKITFSIYGTLDGRSSKIIGPTVLELIKPQQDPQVEVAQNLQAGQEKQLEFAITGAKTTATYEITYADGSVKKQVFNSYYHPVQAKYKVGAPAAGAQAPAASPAPASVAAAQ